MTKAKQILALYERALGTMPEHKLTGYVAAKVGTTPSYVRTVARQRLGRGTSESEQRYMQSPLGKAKSRRHSHHWYWHGGGKEWQREYARLRRNQG